MTSPHPDDERLNAYLDGEDTGAAEHLASCADCQARLDAFRRVAAAVGAPVGPAPAESREAAIAAALALAPASGADGADGADVVALRSGRPARTPFLLGAAALVLVVLVAVSVLSKGGDENRPGGDALMAEPEAGRMAAGGGAGGPADGGDLGDQADARALADRLRAVLEPPAAADEAPQGSGGSGEAVTGGAPLAVEAQSSKRNGAASSTAAGDCTATVAREYGSGLGPLAYRATLRWEGAPAVVLVYPIIGATSGLDRRVLVMARSDCRLLVAQTI
jgi:hypothetical protein